VTQARWRLTHLLPADDPQQIVALPPSVAVGGVLCNEWFERWQEAKTARRSRVRVNMKRGERNPRRPVTGPIGRSGGLRRSARCCRTWSRSETSPPWLMRWKKQGEHRWP
jgi:hypothetical protein